ncbi:chromosome segregation protein SMC [Psychrobium sp. nBUS_13]|uniref:chromosome segregation protein SMC n=1 Tax=Psychrobium sp. nBUS_13 TaxID=3395319 RepID=UPI003EBFE449
MRLKHLKLAGFKSFVDPTVIPFTQSLSAVVGPNGCGKSNIIDAVRWVLGESSAKNLRGDDMSDVIFNGSNARKPVSVASVELLFDNTDGRAQGPWQQFSEISIKRQVSRQGQSDYFVNGQKCRRRDIADLLSGTGLGPRSYSIIEQGTISRLVESKPAELRGFIEDAAGISKYKERKRDTLNRIKNSRDNLERLNDLHHELKSQIESLESQAKEAQEYTALKKQERILQTDIVVNRWQTFAKQLEQTRTDLETSEQQLLLIGENVTKVTAQDTATSDQIKVVRKNLDVANESYHTHQTEITRLSLNIEHLIQAQSQSQHLFEQVKLKRESLSTQIAEALELSLQHELALSTQQQELAPLTDNVNQLKEAVGSKEALLETIESKLFTIGNERQQNIAKEQLFSQRVDALNSQRMKTSSQIELLDKKRVSLAKQQQTLDPVARDESYQLAKHQLLQCEANLQDLEAKASSLHEFLSQNQHEIYQAEQKIALLGQEKTTTAQQLNAKTKNEDESVNNYFSSNKQLWQGITIAPKWQLACDIIIGDDAGAYLVDSYDEKAPSQSHTQLWSVQENLSLSPSSIVHHITSNDAKTNAIVRRYLGQILCADDKEHALDMLSDLTVNQMIITPAGEIFKDGGFWQKDSSKNVDGIMQLQQRLQELTHQLEQQNHHLQHYQSLVDKTSLNIEQLTPEITQATAARQSHIDSVTMCKQQWLLEQQQWEHIATNLAEVSQQVDDLQRSDVIDADAISSIKNTQEEVLAKRQYSDNQLDALKQEKQLEKQQTKRLQSKLELVMAQTHQGELALQKLEMQLINEQQQIAQYQQTQTQLNNEYQQLKQKLTENNAPLAEKQSQLTQRKQTQNNLNNQRSQFQEQLVTLEKDRVNQSDLLIHANEKKSLQHKAIEQLRLKVETLKVKLQSQRHNTPLSEREMAERALEIADAVDSKLWPAELDNIRDKLANMGAINLTAIEQYNEQKQRFDELTNQTDDLEQGLQTLEKAIKKIDRQSREKFKHTFNSVNQDFQRLFPKVFGGGSAQLTLTDSDLLVAGVSIMAQPPGKKNSTIHLLSGGEKALTALSLVFSIFQLNPAPFCMLDEVDAPLDDANVDRYCNLVNEMSEKVQFIYITHNKVSMEMANQLTGVTMQEAGVSRIVAVDVDEAVSMVQQ